MSNTWQLDVQSPTFEHAGTNRVVYLSELSQEKREWHGRKYGAVVIVWVPRIGRSIEKGVATSLGEEEAMQEKKVGRIQDKEHKGKNIGLHGRLNNFAQLMEANRSKVDSGFSFQFHKIGPM